MDAICKFDVKDTDSESPDRRHYAALVRAILTSVGPEITDTFNACSLRYHLTLKNGEVVGIGPKISHRTGSEGYYDDDYTSGSHRLGGTSTLGTIEQKDLFEKLLAGWFEFAVLRLERSTSEASRVRSSLRKKHPDFDVALGSTPKRRSPLRTINKALRTLVPDEVRKRSDKLSMKVDAYTNRVLLGWHKDGNDQHALILGLLNISDGPIGSTELFFAPDVNARAELDGIATNRLRPASKRRKAMLDRLAKGRDVENTQRVFHRFDEQKVGEIRWFNDAVWVHRTPPLKRFADADQTTAWINNCGFEVPHEIQVETNVSAAYEREVDQLVPAQRMLIRITIRDMYEPCAEVWFGHRATDGDKRVFLRSPGADKVKWAYVSGPRFDEFPTELCETQSEPGWCLQTCTPTEFSKYQGKVLTFSYWDPERWSWEPVPVVVVPRTG